MLYLGLNKKDNKFKTLLIVMRYQKLYFSNFFIQKINKFFKPDTIMQIKIFYFILNKLVKFSTLFMKPTILN